MSTTPRVLGGRYEVGRLIGRGGMADVHLGHDTRLGRQVAIKILRSDLARDAGFLGRFRREAQSAAGLNHPSIVAIFDSGEDDRMIEGPNGVPTTHPYMVMEYVDGKTLRELLNERGQFTPDQAIWFTEGVLDALSYSHRMGIVHRDIKPANVMITSTGHVKVMDFGIARAIADTAATMTATSSVVGTAQYLSPEQAQGQVVDARSDLYSAGCMLFELLAGRPPFTGDSPVAIAYQHVGEQPPAPSSFNTAVADDLDAVTLHALAKDRDARYQDASTFRNDLENVRLGRPISEAALGTAAGMGAGMGAAGATQTMPAPYAVAGTPTVVQPQITSRRQRYENTAGLPAVGHDEDAVDDRRGNGGKAALFTLLALALLGAVVWGAMNLFSSKPPAVATTFAVPKIVDLREDVAKQTILRSGRFKVGEKTDVPSDKPSGTVVSQSPEAASMVAAGTAVDYEVSSGPATKKIPDLTGMDKQKAKAELEALDFDVKLEEEHDPAQDKDNVLSTTPKAGTDATPNSKVTVFFASGKVMVPKGLVGMDYSLMLISEFAPLKLEAERQDKESERPINTVLSVEKEGELVDVGTTLKVEVAKTPVATSPPSTTPTGTATGDPTSPPPSEEDKD